jgi:hypothetical protein
MSALLRFLKLTSYNALDERLAQLRAKAKDSRDEIRQKGYETLATLNPMTDGPKIMEVMKDVQLQLDKLHYAERLLMEYASEVKS